MKKQTELHEAVRVLKKALKNDEDYKQSWVANIAVVFQDHVYRYKKATKRRELNIEEIHKISNEAAEAFINTLCR